MTKPTSTKSPLPRPENGDVLDERLETLVDTKDKWVGLPLADKIELAQSVLDKTLDVADRQVAAAVQAKSIPRNSPLIGEEWLGGPMVILRTLRLTIDTLKAIDANGSPKLPRGSVRTRDDGQTVVDVFPASYWDRLLFNGFSAQIWMQDEVTPKNLDEYMAEFYRRPSPEGKVALVLGAGNVASIGPLDVLYKLFVEGQVCILKMNPVNDYLGPFIEESFAELMEGGFLRMAYGGADVGSYLCHHESVDEIHITGSDATHDAIVYGVGDEGARRKEEDERLLDKRITSELGNVSPVIVVPGDWKDSDLRFQAENVATQLANNGGFNCNAARVLITSKNWPQRETFLDHLRTVLAEIEPRKPYYPGALERFSDFVEESEGVESFGPDGEGCLPWTLIVDVDCDEDDHICFSTESFCGVMSETSLDADDPSAFLRQATLFCNDRVWGTLSASIIIDPSTAKEHAEALDSAIAELEYGSVVVNHWPAISYGLGVTSWGAFPGHTYDDIQSGIGVVHNSLMFDRPEKSVIKGPFRVFPKPPWFVTNRNTHRIARRLTAFEHDPSFLKFIGVIKEALKG